MRLELLTITVSCSFQPIFVVFQQHKSIYISEATVQIFTEIGASLFILEVAVKNYLYLFIHCSYG